MQKSRGRAVLAFAFILTLCLTFGAGAAKQETAGASPQSGPAACYPCHPQTQSLKEGSKHAGLPCSLCHENTSAHLASFSVKPKTRIDASLCGGCHRNQYESSQKVNYEAPARKEKGIPTGRSPLQEKLLAPHGFTKEHNEPRAHVFMVTDQFIVDRFAGGRFQYKKGVRGVDEIGRAWDVLYDTGRELPETARAGNATCISCKTTDHLLTWKYMGDKNPKAQWDRGSDAIAISKATSNPMSCVHCHDAHGAVPRVVRDALIEAVDKEGARTFAGKDGKTDLRVIDFRGFRKIGVLTRTDSRLQCGQCHVEYACNTGFEFDSGRRIGYEDRRTNHYPLKGAMDILEHYKKINFYDFRHAVTGARLVKLQHPEVETYAGSVHDRAGIQCHHCHMPRISGKDGRTFTNHGAVRPLHAVREACLGCHPQDSPERKRYQIEAVQNYTKGKIRKAEYWLGQLIDAYAAAKKAGVSEAVLARARECHEEAHVLWEWWTAENSDGWHNPGLARESLTASIAASKKGIAALNGAGAP